MTRQFFFLGLSVVAVPVFLQSGEADTAYAYAVWDDKGHRIFWPDSSEARWLAMAQKWATNVAASSPTPKTPD